MFNYGLKPFAEDDFDQPKLYQCRTSDSCYDEEEQKQSWHEEFPDFQFLKEITTTDSSTVWVVKNLRDESIKVAKIVPKEKNTFSLLTQTSTELEFLSTSKLQNSLQIFQIQKSDDFYLILMEYCKNGDLASYTHFYTQNLTRKFSMQHLNWVRFCFGQIVKAIQELHLTDYIHRDLKPSNFLVTDSGHIKLSDFGMVVKNGSVDPKIKGTLQYMAPERLDSKKAKLPITPAVDMWALGLILYELLMGHVPYEQNGKEDLLQVIYSGYIKMDSKIPSQAKNLIYGLLQINPTKRMTMEQLKKHPYFGEMV